MTTAQMELLVLAGALSGIPKDPPHPGIDVVASR